MSAGDDAATFCKPCGFLHEGGAEAHQATQAALDRRAEVWRAGVAALSASPPVSGTDDRVAAAYQRGVRDGAEGVATLNGRPPVSGTATREDVARWLGQHLVVSSSSPTLRCRCGWVSAEPRLIIGQRYAEHRLHVADELLALGAQPAAQPERVVETGQPASVGPEQATAQLHGGYRSPVRITSSARSRTFRCVRWLTSVSSAKAASSVRPRRLIRMPIAIPTRLPLWTATSSWSSRASAAAKSASAWVSRSSTGGSPEPLIGRSPRNLRTDHPASERGRR